MQKVFRNKYVKDILIFLLFFIFAGFLSVKFGVERSWDTRNYHIYSPWAFLNNRYTIDIMPAGIQSYFNPLLDIPYFLIIKYFNNYPMQVTFLWGFSYGLYLFMVYKISALIFKNSEYQLVSIVFSVFMASGISALVKIIGWLTHDIFIFDLILIALYLIFKSINKEYSPRLLFSSGVITGAAVGLKYSAAIYALPLFLTFAVFGRQFINPLRCFFILTLGAITGFFITAGFWMYNLYKHFQNPLFPYFNQFFHSDFISSVNVFATDFSNSGKKNIWLYPFKYYNELKWKLLYILFFINIFTIPLIDRNKFKQLLNIDVFYADFLVMLSGLAYIVWVKTFATDRYYLPMAGFVGIFAIIAALKLFFILNNLFSKIKHKFKIKIFPDIIKFKNIYTVICIVSVLIMFPPTYKFDKGKGIHRFPVKDRLITIDNLKIPDNSIVLLQHGTAFIVPFQNPHVTYIHINSRLFTINGKNIFSQKTLNRIKNKIKNNSDKIYIVFDFSNENLEIYKNIDIKEIKNNFNQNYLIQNKILSEYATFIEVYNLGLDIRSLKCEKFIAEHRPRYFCSIKIK